MNKEITYKIDPARKRKERFSRSLSRSTQRTLAELEEHPDLPRNFDYFINVMKTVFIDGQKDQRSPLMKLPGTPSKKIIGTYCAMVPEELIYAAGAIPVRLCGGSREASDIGGELVPRDACPVVKASVGFTSLDVLSVYKSCDVVVVPTTCDAKRKMGEELLEFTDVWMLETPHVKETEGAKRQWLAQINTFKKDLEHLTGQKIGRNALQTAIRMIADAQYEARRLNELRKSNAPVIFGREAMLALNAYSYDTAIEWTRAMARLNDELESRYSNGHAVAGLNAPRMLIAGCPPIFPNWKIPSLIETMGAVVVADESCMGGRYLYDPVRITETSMNHMMASIASRYLMPCVCPSFVPNEDRLYRLLQMVDEFNINGIIYHVLKGCVIYDFELTRVEKIMKEKNIPVLRIETDYSPEDVEQLRTRIEAFIEMLGTKKSKLKQG